MGIFNYDNPLIRFLVRAANMMIVSFYWLLCCLPVVTAVPASAALYHTVTRVIIGGTGSGVTKDFFKALKSSLKPGLVLSLIVAALSFLLYLGIHTGLQIWRSGALGAVYMALGVLFALVLAPAAVFLAPVLSRFEGSTGTILRLSLYFSARRLLLSLWFVFLLALCALAVDFFPLVILVLPAVYMDLIRPGAEKLMAAYIAEAGLEEAGEAETPEAASAEPLSATELDRLLSGEKEDGDDGA